MAPAAVRFGAEFDLKVILRNSVIPGDLMFNDAIRSIIDLLRIKKDVKKTDLEIEKLSREKNKSEALIKVASEEDIKKYDPKVERLEKKLAEKAPRQLIKKRPVIIALIIIAIVLMIAEGFILYKIIF